MSAHGAQREGDADHGEGPDGRQRSAGQQSVAGRDQAHPRGLPGGPAGGQGRYAEHAVGTARDPQRHERESRHVHAGNRDQVRRAGVHEGVAELRVDAAPESHGESLQHAGGCAAGRGGRDALAHPRARGGDRCPPRLPLESLRPGAAGDIGRRAIAAVEQVEFAIEGPGIGEPAAAADHGRQAPAVTRPRHRRRLIPRDPDPRRHALQPRRGIGDQIEIEAAGTGLGRRHHESRQPELLAIARAGPVVPDRAMPLQAGGDEPGQQRCHRRAAGQPRHGRSHRHAGQRRHAGQPRAVEGERDASQEGERRKQHGQRPRGPGRRR